MAGVIQSTKELFNIANCKHEKLTESKIGKLSSLPPWVSRNTEGNPSRPRRFRSARKSITEANISSWVTERNKEDDDGNPSQPKRFRANRKSMDEEDGFRPYKHPPPSPGKQ